MATLAIENTIFTLTSGVGVDEYTQSGHGPSPGLKLMNASGSDAVIRMGAVLVLCASGSFGIVRFENKQTAQGGQVADPDVESGFKEP